MTADMVAMMAAMEVTTAAMVATGAMMEATATISAVMMAKVGLR